MDARLTLRPLQEKNCQRVMAEPASLVAQPMGAGKTTVAVEAILREGHKRVLVVAPRNTFLSWKKTIERQYQQPDMLKRIDSTVAGKQHTQEFWDGTDGWYFVTWEFFRTRPGGYWDKTSMDVIILDECQRMQNRNGKTWRNMRNVGKKSKRIAMSGTPQGNKAEGFWTTLRWLFPYDENNSLYTTPRSFWNWVADWLVIEENPYLGFTTVLDEQYEPGTMLSYYQSYIRESDPSEVPAVNEIEVEVKMTAAQKRAYKQAQKEVVVWLEQNPTVIAIPATRYTRMRQILLGEPSINDDGKVSFKIDFKSDKIDAAIEDLSLLPERTPVLAFTSSREFAIAAAARLTAAGYPTFAWVGGTSEALRNKAVERWGEPDGPQVILAVVEAIAEGTDGLQYKCNEEMWFDISSNPSMNTQAESRLPRQGQTKIVNRRRYLVPDTLDKDVLDKKIATVLRSNETLRGQQP